MLESALYADALAAVLSTPIGASNNMTVSFVDDSGEADAVNAEVVPDEVFWQPPEDGLIIHANHFKNSVALTKLRDQGIGKSGCSIYRDRRVEMLLRRCFGNIDMNSLMSALSDRFGAPRGVCRSPIARTGGSRSMTVASIVMDVTDGRMRVRMSPWNNNSVADYML